jgi:ABC-type amino acid transport substrate-binding protein
LSRRWGAGVAVAVAIVLMTVGAALLMRSEDDSSEPVADASKLGLLAEGRLLIGVASPFPPFVIGDPPELSGYEVEVAEAVAEELGVQPRFQDRPFDALLPETAAGRFDLAAPASEITLFAEETVDFADPDYEEQLAILVTTGSDIDDANDLEGKRVGARSDAAGESFAREETGAAKVSALAEDADAIEALITGKVDAVVLDQPVAQAAADLERGLRVAELIPTGRFYGLALAEDGDRLREAVNSALERLRDDGTIARLYQRYFGIQPPESVLESTNEPR